VPQQATYDVGVDAVDVTTSIVVRSPILREGLNKLLLDAGVSAHCENPARDVASLIKAVRSRGADLVILDGSLCETHSQLVVSLRQAAPEVRIVIIAARDSMNRIADESIAAADGILSSETSSEEIMLSLRLIRLGGRVVPPDYLLTRLLGTRPVARSEMPQPSQARDLAPPEQLPSPRETEILHYLTEGCSNKTIARQLGIAEATVKVHLKGLLRRIRVANRTQAAIWAMNNGFGPSQLRRYVSDGRGRCAAADVPGNPVADRGPSGTARASMTGSWRADATVDDGTAAP
jgi:two-component system, NarL family, nitrate/nitrite response regulator NarL